MTWYARLAGLAFGAALVACGVLFLLVPPAGLWLFGLPDGDERLLALVGVRQVAFGLTMLLLAALRESRALAILLLAGMVVPVVDGIVVWLSTSPVAALRHLGAIPVQLAVGLTLLRGRSDG